MYSYERRHTFFPPCRSSTARAQTANEACSSCRWHIPAYPEAVCQTSPMSGRRRRQTRYSKRSIPGTLARKTVKRAAGPGNVPTFSSAAGPVSPVRSASVHGHARCGATSLSFFLQNWFSPPCRQPARRAHMRAHIARQAHLSIPATFWRAGLLSALRRPPSRISPCLAHLSTFRESL